MSYIELENVVKKFKVFNNKIIANNNISFSLEKGEFVVILGTSGAGKSTLLNILGGMEKPDSGNIFIDGKNIAKFNNKELTDYRRFDVGFIFQFYNLLPNLTALENVELATDIANNTVDSYEILRELGLYERANNFPSQLSGGEQQRVSIARAIAKMPKILLCDEPTGALDYKTGIQVLKLLKKLSKDKNITVIIVTHNSAISEIADKIIHIHDAKIKNIDINTSPKNVEELEW
ncbi:ABC transporter ATP-binding protein [Pseudostreptobacillus hongkongensis]|uniref:ABC transporter ATP-binding protein n=1 Tax=Pseudostreptobacillus hongkongensis TaxID=1162717 RepID=UPI00083719BA|nr:ABC transporter ATP-binding protein [Pseudostreptobacillus hongkongensis]